VVGVVTRLLATALAVVLAQHVLAGTTIDLGARAAPVALGVMLVCAGMGLRSRRRVPYLGDGVAVALLVPLRGPLCDLVGFLSPSGPVTQGIAALVSTGPLAFVLGRQLGGCLQGSLPPVLLGFVGGQLLGFAGAAGWLPSWALGAIVAAVVAALAEVGRPRREEPVAGEESVAALTLGAILVLWVDVLTRITSGYTAPSPWPGGDALLVMLALSAIVAWPASLLVPRTRPRTLRALACVGAIALAVVLWSSVSELAIYKDQVKAVALARKLHDRSTRIPLVEDWWLWLAAFAGLRAAAGGLVLGALGARSLGLAALGGGFAVLGLAWLPLDPTMRPTHELLTATGLALATVPLALFGRRGLALLPLAGLPFLLLSADERPRFDEIRRQGEFGVQVTERRALADVVLFATPDVDSVASEGRQAAITSCTCERAALILTEDGRLARSLDERDDPARPCYGLRVAGVPLHAGHRPVGAAGSVGRLLRVFGPSGRWLVSGVGAELLAADLHDAGLLDEATVASSVPLGRSVAIALLDALGSRAWSAAQVHDPVRAATEPGGADLDGVVVAPEHVAWDSSALHTSREHIARLMRRLRPGGRCLLFLDTSALDASALEARLAAFGSVFGERCAAFVEPRELDAPFVLAVGWKDDAGRPEQAELAARLAGLESSPLRARLHTPQDLGALLLRDGPGMLAGAERGAPTRRARPAPPGRWNETGWAAVAAVADPDARLDRVVSGASARSGASPDVLAGLRRHATYRYRLTDLNETTFFVPEDVDWSAFDEEAAHYVAASGRDSSDALLQLALAALLEPLAMAGDYGRFARVYEACGAQQMESVRLALLEAWVQRQSLEEAAAERALERAQSLRAGGG
jgi:hypothetical protein